MKKINLKFAIFFAACSLAACNLFNPTGSGDTPNNKEALFNEAYVLYRDGDYEEALENFNKALKKDSTLSEAYLGAAKAVMGIYKINVFTMLGEVRLAQKGEIPFLNLSGQELENYQAMISEALPYIRELARRDTIKPPKKDPYRYSDKKITFGQIAAGYSIFEMAESLLKFRQSTQQFNLTITQDPNTGKLAVDLNEMYASALEKPETVEQLNSSILELQNDVQNFTQNILPSVEEFTDLSIFVGESSAESLTGEIENTANELQSQIAFFMVNDKIDNDGDGCVDEEIFDKKDNDGDGLVDEDLRVTLLTRLSEDPNTPEFSVVLNIGKDGLDHDMDKIIDGEGELQYAVDAEERLEEKNFLLKFANENDFKNLDSLSLKYEVSVDTLKEDLKYNLSWRQKNIGGCWTNYDDSMFDAWIRGNVK